MSESATSEKVRGLSKDEQDQLDRSNKKAKPSVPEIPLVDAPMTEKDEPPGDLAVVPMEDVPKMIKNRAFEQPGQWSYKDRLIGVNGGDAAKFEQEKADEKYWDEEDFSEDDMENDKAHRARNVLCPGVEVNRERRISLCRMWRKCLIVKVLGKVMGFHFLQEKLRKLWNPSGLMEIIDLPNNFYSVRFEEDKDFDYALSGGPWMVAGHYLMCQRWKPEFDADDDSAGRQAVWVRIPKLPIEYYEKHLLWEVGNEIGRTLKVDEHTLNEKRKKGKAGMFLTERGQFARICVEIDLQKTLVPMVRVRTKEYNVEYEGLGLICFECGRFGHRRDQCPLTMKQAPPTEVRNPARQQTPANDGVNGHPKQGDSDAIFGPWMIPQRRRGRPRINKNNGVNEGERADFSQQNKGKEIAFNGGNMSSVSGGNKFDSLGDLMEDDSDMIGIEGGVHEAENSNIDGPNQMGQDAIVGHMVINSKEKSNDFGPNSHEAGKYSNQRNSPKKKNGGGQVSHASGPNRNVEFRVNKSPKKTDIVARGRERVGRTGLGKNTNNVASTSTAKGLNRAPGVDVGTPKIVNKGGTLVEEELPARKPPDDIEIWRAMKYEEKRLKEAGQDPMDISSSTTRIHSNFL